MAGRRPDGPQLRRGQLKHVWPPRRDEDGAGGDLILRRVLDAALGPPAVAVGGRVDAGARYSGLPISRSMTRCIATTSTQRRAGHGLLAPLLAARPALGFRDGGDGGNGVLGISGL